MAFLGKLFKRKPGGTKIGNLIRGVVSNSPLGAAGIGSGAGMISQVDADKRDLNDADFEAKYGQTKNGVTVQVANTTNNTPTTPTTPTTPGTKMASWFKKKWVKIAFAVLGTLLLIGVIVWAVKKGKRKGGRSRY